MTDTPYPLDPIDLTTKLVAIASVNPALVPGGAGESDIADYCLAWLNHYGFETYRLEKHPGRPSVVGVMRGSGHGKSLMLNGHIDTVTLAGYDGDPLTPRIDGNRMYGRGAFDMKNGVAANMIATVRAAQTGLAGDVIVCCVADEEHASLGTAEVLEQFTADAGIVTEPMSLEPTLWHKGFMWIDVTIHGRAYHGSRPEFGIDAIAKAGHFLAALDSLATEMNTREGHPRLGPGSIHASMIKGGEEASSYPAACTITIERRTIPGETPEMVVDELTDILDRLVIEVPDFAYSIEPGLVRQPFETDAQSNIAQCLLRHAEKVLGQEPKLRAEPFWTDASLMDQAGIPTLLFGADGAGAHAADEWVDIDSVRQLTEVLVGVITEWCG
ncbi:MAG: M20/M25/M40 family metallo-hydrolase [Thermomicrobiales bacterium]|nr:M20/M25/M40 family metallo-hydrolase [Thermomicrobiales bacterium]